MIEYFYSTNKIPCWKNFIKNSAGFKKSYFSQVPSGLTQSNEIGIKLFNKLSRTYKDILLEYE
jgi:hypothetical protein